MENFNVKVRTEKGKNANYRLRQSGYVPAVLYSNGTSEAVQFEYKEFFKAFGKNISLSKIFDVNVDGANSAKAYIKDYQVDPVTSELLHVDFFKVDDAQKVRTKVAVKLVGTAKGIKVGGIIQKGDRTIGLECAASILPEVVEIDVTELMPGQSIRAKDVVLAEGVRLTTNQYSTLVSLNTTRMSSAEEGEESEEEAATE